MINVRNLTIESKGSDIFICALVDNIGPSVYYPLYHFDSIDTFREFLMWGMDYVKGHETPVPDYLIKEFSDAADK